MCFLHLKVNSWGHNSPTNVTSFNSSQQFLPTRGHNSNINIWAYEEHSPSNYHSFQTTHGVLTTTHKSSFHGSNNFIWSPKLLHTYGAHILSQAHIYTHKILDLKKIKCESNLGSCILNKIDLIIIYKQRIFICTI